MLLTVIWDKALPKDPTSFRMSSTISGATVGNEVEDASWMS